MSNERERGLTFPLRALDYLAERRVNKSLNPEDLYNLEQARQFLKGGSLLLVFNHPTVLDPRFVVSLVDRLRRLFTSYSPAAVPTTRKFADGRMGRLGEIHAQVARVHRVDVPYIVQDYEMSTLEGQDLAIAQGENYTALRKALEILKTREPGGILFIAPEGTRSTNKKMGRGLEMVGRMMQDVCEKTEGEVRCLPIGIETDRFPGDVEQLGLVKKLEVAGWLVGSNLRLHIGELVGLEELRQDVGQYQARTENFNLTDAMMLRVALLLPEDYWGYYGQFPRSR